MHVLVVTDNIPNTKYGGGALTAWSVIRSLQQQGHRVTALLLLGDVSLAGTDEARAWLQALADAGAAYTLVEMDPPPALGPPSLRRRLQVARRVLAPRLDEVCPAVRLAPQVAELVARYRPDAVFAYHWIATAAASRLTGVPRLAIVGDLDHRLWRYRWQYAPRRWDRTGVELLARAVVTSRRMPRLLGQLLGGFEASGSFAAQHAADLRRYGVARCRYIHTPVEDLAGPQWRQRRESQPAHPRLRILMIGHLKGLATRAGLALFARHTLPALEQALGRDGFEVRIVGRFEPPAALRPALEHPAVTRLGFVDDVADEFFGADVLLVPTPIPISLRVRILTGMAFGCCVVTHAANGLGIPELVDGENCLMARDGAGLARQMLRAWQDPALRRRIGEGARRTYDEFFAPQAAGREIAAILEQVAECPRRGAPEAVGSPAGQGPDG